MKQLCPVCGEPISKNWLLLGSPSTPYQCPKCKSRLEFTGKRYLISFLTGLIAALPVLLVFFFNFSSWKFFLFYYLIVFVLDILFILNIDGQFKVEVKGDYSAPAK